MPGEVEKQRSAFDQQLLQNANLSPRELSEKFGISEIDAVQRISRLLDSRDWLTLRQMEMRLLLEVEDMKNEARERLKNMPDEFYAPTLNATSKLLEATAGRIDSRKRDVAQDIDAITSKHAQVFGNVFDSVLRGLTDWLTSEYPEIDDTAMNRQVGELLKGAAVQLEEQVSDLGIS